MHDAERERLEARINALEVEIAVLRDIHNTPIVEPFALAAACEAKHQRLRHGDEHDAGKSPWDWYWTLGYLGSKAAKAHEHGDIPKALHHTVTAAALLANWHRHLTFAISPVPAPDDENAARPEGGSTDSTPAQ